MTAFQSADFAHKTRSIVVPISTFQSPVIVAERFKRGTVQWFLEDSPNAGATGVVNPATARLYGTTFPDVEDPESQPKYDISSGYAGPVDNVGLWHPITWAAWISLPNGVVGNGVLELESTRAYLFFSFVWEVTTEMNLFSQSYSFLRD